MVVLDGQIISYCIFLDVSSDAFQTDPTKDKGIKSSTKFFKQLQEEVQTQVKEKKSLKQQNEKRKVSAAKLKL